MKLVVIVAAGLLSFVGTGWVRKLVLARSVIDVPNARSLHHRPTPRGGGLALSAAALLGIAVLAAMQAVPRHLAIALLGGGALIATVGWLDDVMTLGRLVRIVCQVAAAVWALAWIGWLPVVQLGDTPLWVGAWGAPLALVWVVWATNLYNFMDGIDGIAATEAVCVGVAAALLLWPRGSGALAALSLLVAASALGFLPWNWTPARLFMGDVGSSLLGFLLACLSIASERAGQLPLLLWALLLGSFVFDATVTLLRRMAAGERWWEAHKKHAYQRVVQGSWSHARTSLAVAVLNVVLALLAWLAVRQPEWMLATLAGGALILASAYAYAERLFPMYSRR